MRLICYPTSEIQPEIRVAPATRPWMDQLPSEYGYRCLPLTIANSHGWEILCVTPFEARRNGNSNKDAIEITALGEARMLPVSHFGSGVLTFHTGYLFETLPGFSLWVSGPPNNRKHGITPLTGVVETDWSPYSFTMNWAFTAPDQPIRFEAGEPFCSFFPIQRGLLEQFEPEMRDFGTAPEKQKHHTDWLASRKNFLADLPKPGTDANDERWQKNYYRGFKPDGEPAPPGHQIKLRLKPFKPK